MGYCGPRGIPLSTFLDWPESDQAAALAWAGHESQRCSSCGFHPDDDPTHMHVDICPGCVAREKKTPEAKDVPGAHVRTAHGRLAHCERCRLEREANAATPRR